MTVDNASGPAGHLVLIRHGETEWSRTGRHTGRTDVPLTATGEERARALAAALAAYTPKLVLVSPRKRAQRTAELAGIEALEVDPDLAEWDYGAYEGLTRAEIRRVRPGWTIWTGTPTSGETIEEVTARADRVLDRIRPIVDEGSDVLVFSHGHFGRALAARWLGQPASLGAAFQLDPATLCVLGEDREQPVLIRWNLPPGGVAPIPVHDSGH